MDKKKSFGVTIIGVIQALICLFLGVPSFVGGFSWVLSDVIAIATNGGGNLTGLGLIIGLPIALSGGVFLFGFVSAILMLKRNPKGRKRTIIFMSIATVLLVVGIKVRIFLPMMQPAGSVQYLGLLSLLGTFNVVSIIFLTRPQIREQFIETDASVKQSKSIKLTALFIIVLIVGWSLFNAIRGNISWNRKVAQEQKHEEELENSRDRDILREFEKNQHVTVMVVCKIRQNLHGSSVEAMQAERRQSAMKLIIEPLGSEISNYTIHPWGDHDVYFVAEVTKDGYERLKHNMHVWKIKLPNAPW